MTLEEALVEVKRVTSAGGPWAATDFVRSDELAKGALPGPLDHAEAVILNAVASGELITLTDHKLTVAEAYRKAASHIVAEAEKLADGMERAEPALAFLKELAAECLALADPDDLAEVQALRAERDFFKSYAQEKAEMLSLEIARAEAAEAEVARLQKALTDILACVHQPAPANRPDHWHVRRVAISNSEVL